MKIATSVLVILTAAIAANVTSSGNEIVVASIGSFCCTLPSALEDCGIPIKKKLSLQELESVKNKFTYH